MEGPWGTPVSGLVRWVVPPMTPQPWRNMCWGLEKSLVWTCGLGTFVTSKQKGPLQS